MSLMQDIIDAGPYPTTLSFFAAGDATFAADDCLNRLNLKYSFDSKQDLPEADTKDWKSLVWYRTLHIQDYPYPILVWAGEGELDADEDVLGRASGWELWPEGDRTAVRAVRSHLHVETILHPDNAQLAYGFLMKIGALLAGRETLGCFDRHSFRMRRPEEVYDLTASEAPPSLAELYTTFAFGGEDVGGRVSLATFGLLRCLRPELLLLEVDQRFGAVARDLLDALAGTIIAHGAPEPLAPFALSDSPPVLATIPRSQLGPAAAAIGPAEHTVAVFPADPLEAESRGPGELHDGDFARYSDALLMTLQRLGIDHVSPYESKIREVQARERFGEFMKLWDSPAAGDLEFLYKVGVEITAQADSEAEEAASPVDQLFAAATGEEVGETKREAPLATKRREHLWFRLSDVSENQLRGELLNEPFEATELNIGETFWHRPDELSDWGVRLPDGSLLGPAKVNELRVFLRSVSK